ncbi:hypothetical protein ACP26F_02945 [Franconibacter pulveris 1160]|nr:hypothetical protein [Franconibacter pulveris]
MSLNTLRPHRPLPAAGEDVSISIALRKADDQRRFGKTRLAA